MNYLCFIFIPPLLSAILVYLLYGDAVFNQYGYIFIYLLIVLFSYITALISSLPIMYFFIKKKITNIILISFGAGFSAILPNFLVTLFDGTLFRLNSSSIILLSENFKYQGYAGFIYFNALLFMLGALGGAIYCICQKKEQK